MTQSRNWHIIVQPLGSGWAAVQVAEFNDGDGMGWYLDINDTGLGRYATEDEAVAEAIQWSADIGSLFIHGYPSSQLCSWCSTIKDL